LWHGVKTGLVSIYATKMKEKTIFFRGMDERLMYVAQN